MGLFIYLLFKEFYFVIRKKAFGSSSIELEYPELERIHKDCGVQLLNEYYNYKNNLVLKHNWVFIVN